jgi:hypothetical protein
MAANNQEKIYLLPQTIGYYQQELTRLLEFERYRETMEMLQFLLSCDTSDLKARDEWQSLLEWMQTMIPELHMPPPPEGQEQDLSEDELFYIHMKEKAEREPEYVEKLLAVFERPDSWDKQVLALEQLRYLQHPRLRDVLRKWLESQPLPPILQFRTMQILKARGESGSIKIKRGSKWYTVDISDVPAGSDEYPRALKEIFQRVIRSDMNNGFPLEAFAEETWSEFVAYAFGTPVYIEILAEKPEARDAWAAAFHYMLLLTSQGNASLEEIKEVYGITEALEARWERALRVFRDFAKAIFPSIT